MKTTLNYGQIGQLHTRILPAIFLAFSLLAFPACGDDDDDGGNGNGDTMMYPYICPKGTPAEGMTTTENTEKCDEEKECDPGYGKTPENTCAALNAPDLRLPAPTATPNPVNPAKILC